MSLRTRLKNSDFSQVKKNFPSPTSERENSRLVSSSSQTSSCTVKLKHTFGVKRGIHSVLTQYVAPGFQLICFLVYKKKAVLDSAFASHCVGPLFTPTMKIAGGLQRRLAQKINKRHDVTPAIKPLKPWPSILAAEEAYKYSEDRQTDASCPTKRL